MYEVYKAIPEEYYAARSDLARYVILYNEGGMYLDDKSDFKEDLFEYTRKKPDIELHAWRWDKPQWSGYLNNPKGEICNWGIITVPKHFILKMTIEQLCLNAYDDPGSEGGKIAVLRTTGPLLLSIILQSYEHLDNIDINRMSDTPAEYRIFSGDRDHEGIHRPYYGTFKFPVFDTKLLPDKRKLIRELRAWN